MKMEPVTPSPDTTLSSRLVVLKYRTASSSSSRTSSDSEKEIEKLENQFRGLEAKKLYQPTPTSLTKNWYPDQHPLTSSSRKEIADNSQYLLVNSMSGT